MGDAIKQDDVAYEPFDASTWRDPYGVYDWLRQHDPVHRSPVGVWVLSRFQDVWDAARDTETFSSSQGLTFRNEVTELGLAPTIVMMDPPDHTRYRRLVNRGFTPRHVTDLEPELRRYVGERIDAVADAAGPVDFISAVAAPVPNWVVAHYLGVPEEDRTRFGHWTQAIVQAGATGHHDGVADALTELYGYFTELVERRRVEPGDDLVSTLLTADDEGTGIGLEGVLGYAFVMIAGGNDTATGLLGGAAEQLHIHSNQRAVLADDHRLIAGAVEELLRYTSPVQGLCRVVTRDTEVAGTPIRAGERVLLCYGSANRDPREFGPTAGELDVTRTMPRMLTFGSGPHFCLGAAAARLQGRVVLEELLARYPSFEVDVDGATFADGAFTRRHATLPFVAGPPRPVSRGS